MKVLLVNGSPDPKGCTYTALDIVRKRLEENGIETELFQIGNKPVLACQDCGACAKLGRCVQPADLVNEISDKMETADGLIVGSPVHYGSATGAVTSFLDRLMFSMPASRKRMKFGAAVVSCRRGGATATFDQLNKYFEMNQMPVVPSCYWNMVHGFTPEDVYADKEGVRTMQILADNMAYLIKCKTAANLPLPTEPPFVMTHFIREDLLGK